MNSSQNLQSFANHSQLLHVTFMFLWSKLNHFGPTKTNCATFLSVGWLPILNPWHGAISTSGPFCFPFHRSNSPQFLFLFYFSTSRKGRLSIQNMLNQLKNIHDTFNFWLFWLSKLSYKSNLLGNWLVRNTLNLLRRKWPQWPLEIIASPFHPRENDQQKKNTDFLNLKWSHSESQGKNNIFPATATKVRCFFSFFRAILAILLNFPPQKQTTTTTNLTFLLHLFLGVPSRHCFKTQPSLSRHCRPRCGCQAFPAIFHHRAVSWATRGTNEGAPWKGQKRRNFFVTQNLGQNRLHPRNLTWNLKMMVSNRNLLFQGLIFRFYVKLRGSKQIDSGWWFQFNPFEKYACQNGNHFSRDRGEHRK